MILILISRTSSERTVVSDVCWYGQLLKRMTASLYSDNVLSCHLGWIVPILASTQGQSDKTIKFPA